MKQADLAPMIPELLRVGQEAAAITMRGYRRADLGIRKKGVIDLVTEFDLASQEHVVKELTRSFPHIRVVGEEGDAASAVADDELVFFVDPIDGTTNFAHGHPFFCVSIGLCKGGTPLAGVVVAPALGVSWTAVVGEEMLRNGEPCRVSATDTLRDSLCATGFGYQVVGALDDNQREFALVQQRARGVRRCGAAAIDLALVADGTYDVYWEFLLQPWDMAAGAALVLAAGGAVSSFEEQPADVRTGSCIASNGRVHHDIAQLIREARDGQPVPVRGGR